MFYKKDSALFSWGSGPWPSKSRPINYKIRHWRNNHYNDKGNYQCANHIDPIKTVPSQFQADMSIAYITYRYTIISFTSMDQQRINSLIASYKPPPPIQQLCTQQYPNPRLSHFCCLAVLYHKFLSLFPPLHCPSHARIINSKSMPNRVCNTAADIRGLSKKYPTLGSYTTTKEFRVDLSCCTVLSVL
jgi:hypothetical protein